MISKIRENKFLTILVSVIKSVITMFLLLLICIIFIQRVTNNNFAIGGVRVFTIITGSMMPEYEVGDMIIAVETEPRKINVGDNVVYRGLVDDFNSKIVTHKVIEKSTVNGDYKFITKGINNSIEDPEIDGEQIVGKVVYKTMILSFISKLINSSDIFFFIVFILFIVLVFFEVMEICEDRKREKEEDNEE